MSEYCAPSKPGLYEVRVLRPSALTTVVTGDGEEAFEVLIERWRMSAFEMYSAIRQAQRDRQGRTVSSRLVALGRASDLAQTLVEEIAALRVAVPVDLSDDASYGAAV
jgi:hypothetical protein